MVTRFLHRVSVPLVVAALVVLAGLCLGRVYNGPLLVQLVGGAALGSVVISVALRRAPGWLAAPVSVVGLAAYAALAVAVSAQAGGVPGDLRTLVVDAARNAVPRLLTALIPVEAQPDTVLAPVVLAWLAGFAGAELAARAGRPAVALVPPTLLYVGALVLVGPNAPAALWQALLFASVAAVGLAAGGAASGVRRLPGIDPGQRAALRLRAWSGLAVGLVTVVAAAGVVAPLVARFVGGSPTDPRRYVAPPSLDVLDQNPLIRISGWAANPEQHLFDVAVIRGAERPEPLATPDAKAPAPTADPTVVVVPTDEPEGPVVAPEADPGVGSGAYDTRLRLAVLSDWDGVTWHVDADYRNAGRVLPPVPAPPDDGIEGSADLPPPLTIEERITVAELQGRLLPAVSAPQRVDGVRVAYDQSTGSLLHSAPLTPGVSYTVTSVNPSIDVNLLPAAEVPSGPGVARYLGVGSEVPPDLTQLAQQIATGESSPYLRALALESFLAEHYQYAADAPSGHAYPNLRFFLFEDPRAGGRRGTSEQFAAGFASLGRLMGLPTRVVVGFQTPAGGGPITGAEALAWPEVLFAGIGWVAFEPMPESDLPPRPLEDEFLPKPPPPTSPPESVEPSPGPTWTAPPPTRTLAAAPADGPGAGVIAGGVGGGVLTLVVLFFALVVLLRASRSRSRFRGDPPRQVLGAWEEVLDALVLAGSPPPAHLAAAEVAEHAAAVARAAPAPQHARRPRPAAPALDDLAAKVNAVGFAGGTAAAPDELAALGARAQAVEYGRALRSRRSWWRRVLWRIDPRPLRRRR
jgi:transglutaminase-like putative cysteine protease